MSDTKNVYLPPYLVDVRTGDVCFFNLDLAKNPYLHPLWDPPDQLYGKLTPERAAAAHKRACEAVQQLHLTKLRFDDLTAVREATARNYGIPPEQYVEIGLAPNAPAKRSRRSYGAPAEDGLLRPVIIPLESSPVAPSETPDAVIVTGRSGSSGETVRRRLAANTLSGGG